MAIEEFYTTADLLPDADDVPVIVQYSVKEGPHGELSVMLEDVVFRHETQVGNVTYTDGDSVPRALLKKDIMHFARQAFEAACEARGLSGLEARS